MRKSLRIVILMPVLLFIASIFNVAHVYADSTLSRVLGHQNYKVNEDGTVTVTVDITDELRDKCEKAGVRLESVIDPENPKVVLDSDDLHAIAENKGVILDTSSLPSLVQIMEKASSKYLDTSNQKYGERIAEILVGKNGGGKAMQSFYDEENGCLYITQNFEGTVTLSKYYAQRGNTYYEYCDSMTINDAGHAQTLEQFTYGGKIYFLVTLGVNFIEDMYWSTEIGCVEYKPGTTVNSANLKRYTGFKVGNGSDEIKRVDAALSSDKSRIVVWKKDTANKIEVSGYSFSDFKKVLLDNTTGYTASITKLSKEYSFNNKSNNSLLFPKSFQGIDVSNMVDGVSSIYIAGGKEALFNDSPLIIARYTSNGNFKKAYRILYSETGPYKEMEGIHIHGDYLDFGLVPAPAQKGVFVDKSKQHIYNIDKNLFK